MYIIDFPEISVAGGGGGTKKRRKIIKELNKKRKQKTSPGDPAYE